MLSPSGSARPLYHLYRIDISPCALLHGTASSRSAFTITPSGSPSASSASGCDSSNFNMRAFDLFLGALALFSRVASQPSPPPTCTNLTGWWCCQPTNLTQVGSSISTVGPAYGNGTGTITGSVMSIQFTNQPSGVLLNGTLSPDCSTVSWDNGGEWTRSISPPWTGPAVPAPAWAYGLSILEVNALAYTSPNGTGSLGDGSGTWAALTERVPFWQSLGIEGIWLAYFSLSTAHFYGIRSVYGCLDPAQVRRGSWGGWLIARQNPRLHTAV